MRYPVLSCRPCTQLCTLVRHRGKTTVSKRYTSTVMKTKYNLFLKYEYWTKEMHVHSAEFLPSRLAGFRLNKALSKLCASGLRNWGMPSLALKHAPHSRRDATHTQSCCVSASTNTPVEAAHTMYGTRALTRKRVSTLTLKFVSLFLCGFVLGMVMSRSTSRTETASQQE